jgi:predicted 2-oxoglutarate/Fe(II)-dependent dioxygenase YbiX
MLLQLLTPEEVDFCVKNSCQMEDGSKSKPLTGSKNNEESITIPDKVRQLITDKVYNNPFVDSVINPTKVSVNFYNQYKEGGHYDKHIDSFKAEPKVNNTYFDYGFSICLSDDYEGGEFVVDNEIGQIPYKLKAGQVIFFPIIYAHTVAPIKKGVRKAIIGWMSSNVTYEQTYILRNIYDVNMHFIKQNDNEMAVKSTLVQNYLKKTWGR